MKTIKVVLLCAVPALATAIGVSAIGRENRTQAQRQIPLPAQWVPFSADRVIRLSTSSPQHGRFYRRRDGSVATVFTTTTAPVITIHNVQTQTTYAGFPDGSWRIHDLPSWASSRPPRTELRFSEDRSSKLAIQIGGGDVWELRGMSGSAYTHFAVALNGEVVALNDHNNMGLELQNIVVGEPPDEVFLPPPDAVLPTKKTPSPFARE